MDCVYQLKLISAEADPARQLEFRRLNEQWRFVKDVEDIVKTIIHIVESVILN